MGGAIFWTLLGCLAVVLAALAAAYLRGLRRLSATRAGSSHVGRPWAVAAGILVAAVVTTGPLGEFLEERLATHMAQHMVLITVSAPLLAASGCGLPVLVGLPRRLRRSLIRLQRRFPAPGIVGPHVAWGCYIAALWLWHLPAAYDEAVRSEYVHLAEHACFLLTAWLFWWHLLGPVRRRLTGPAAVLYLVAAIPPGAALGALLIFTTHPLYPAQSSAAVAAGANPLTDQRLGGIVMWVPMDFVFVAFAVLLVGRWLRSLQQRWPEPQYQQFLDMAAKEPSARRTS
jgi:cytochrome c oxidase assembly factor CtaG